MKYKSRQGKQHAKTKNNLSLHTEQQEHSNGTTNTKKLETKRTLWRGI